MRFLFIFIWLGIFSGCQEAIVHDLNESDANRIVAHLSDSGIGSSKQLEPAGTWSVSVVEQDNIRAIKAINSSRIIRKPALSSSDKGSIVASREEQRFRNERGISREIESTLLSLPTVLEARVHLNQPVNDPILGKSIDGQVGSGSVLLLVDAGQEVPREEVANLVSGASGIPSDRISVVVAEEPRDIITDDIAMFKPPPVSDSEHATDISIYQIDASALKGSWLKAALTPYGLLMMAMGGGLAALFLAFSLVARHFVVKNRS